jgi:integrase
MSNAIKYNLTDAKARKAKPEPKAYKLSDGGGLFLLVNPNGSKLWRYKFRLDGKEGLYSIGVYPDISLSQAREQHQQARSLVAKGINPKTAKDDTKAEQSRQSKRFSDYWQAWLKRQTLAQSTRTDLVQRVEKNLIPFVDKKPIDEWTKRGLLEVLELIVKRGSFETARRMAGVLRQVFDDIIIIGELENNPADGLIRLLPKPDKAKKQNFAHVIDPKQLADLLRQLDERAPRLDYAVHMAMKLIPLVFLRPYNIRHLRWDYINTPSRLIEIPPDQMKTGKPFIVPLSRQALAIIEAMRPLTGEREFVFLTAMGERTNTPMSENTTTKAFQRLINPQTNQPYGVGFVTSHGFRHTASTLLHEMGYNSAHIEKQLAHEEANQVKGAYNKAEYLAQRSEMMQAWADYLDSLKAGAEVIPIKRRA